MLLNQRMSICTICHLGGKPLLTRTSQAPITSLTLRPACTPCGGGLHRRQTLRFNHHHILRNRTTASNDDAAKNKFLAAHITYVPASSQDKTGQTRVTRHDENFAPRA
ncbi:hypothetical protein COCC4DRAFT_61909 [Bipolaris maydis ATCC 48331]|uniref:Uncharacterized protein n=2 Tax=Cochliobolus heterostrophus TaxID=5016 RepID=M2TKU5_COCH5|nr:uncharacterized protein COCC4DRAFT_61909 [Bipolaris maydis ATCC 48331]EMD87114.1 hypothetical protein COCHEDRAFT_1034311 [Bipolaris maydis C5]ENI03892.1 hypothetical protein COCC4DRAFT_61909 [Bipolaris maydis ATCC 48331]